MTPSIKSAILRKCEIEHVKDLIDGHGKMVVLEQALDHLMPIIRELLDICEAQAKALEDISADPPADQMKSWQTDSLIKVIEYDIDTAKAAITASNERLKRLAGDGNE